MSHRDPRHQQTPGDPSRTESGNDFGKTEPGKHSAETEPGNDSGKKLWGGRFATPVDPDVDAFTRSFGFDHVLAQSDVLASLAHARMLFERQVLDESAAHAILSGLAGMLLDLKSGALAPTGDFEDVHAWLESTLTERIGDAARRLHTGRSRNDQVAVALRLWLREQLRTLVAEVVALAGQFLDTAVKHIDTALPGYTHLQRGQPVSLAHHLLAFFWMFEADGRRLRGAHASAGTCPLGAGALAGTPHDIDPHRSAELLGFERVFANSMFAVADRDYVVEASFACALLQVHLSRWAEEVVLWTTREMGFAELDDSVAKGSSIMPQKKNPEPAEILRGKAGRSIGDLVAHLVQLKGLPLTYNSDLQEDKEALFDSMATAAGSVRVARALERGLRYRPERMAEALRGGFVTATDLADALVKRGSTFRDAHEQTGAAVKLAEQRGVELWELSLGDLKSVCPSADQAIFSQLDPRASLHAHDSAGGPAPVRVKEQIEAAKAALRNLERWCHKAAIPPILEAHRSGTLLASPSGRSTRELESSP